MEPVTHVLTGVCLARAGFNRRAAYATIAMAIAAEFPDIDTLWGLRGPIEGFEHHRGLTHTFLGIPFEAAALLLAFVLYYRLRHGSWSGIRASEESANAKQRHSRRLPEAPVRWDALYVLMFLALVSHLLLDYTNNYGIRPFFPFRHNWYAGSFVFIFDPLLFSLLLAGLLLPFLFGLVSREVGARRGAFGGRGWARAALLGMLALWSVRWFEHGKAVAAAQTQTLRAPADDLEALGSQMDTSPESQLNGSSQLRQLLLPQRSLASPDPFSIFRWYTATDFGPAYRLAVVNSQLETLSPGDILVKPPASIALSNAKRSKLGRVYLDWSPMPLLRVRQGSPEGHPEIAVNANSPQTITFTDLRFLGDVPFLQRDGRAPLTGQVVLNGSGHVIAEGLDGRFEP